MLKRRAPLTYENALSRAAALCAKCEQCSPDILKKLATWGLSAGDASRVIIRLEELRFLDDSRYARAYAHDKLHFSGWGRRKISQGLWAKRLPQEIISEACESLSEEEDEYRAIAVRVIRSKTRQLKEWPLSRESKIKLVKYAMGRGFEYPLVADIVRKDLPGFREENEFSDRDLPDYED